MRATQFVLLCVSVAVALSQPPAFGAVPAPVTGAGCWMVDGAYC